VVSTIGVIEPVGPDRFAYHDFDDLVEQATRPLSERGLTEQFCEAAGHRAHRDHTSDLRVTTILDRLS
jgi:hypothetical protein